MLGAYSVPTVPREIAEGHYCYYYYIVIIINSIIVIIIIIIIICLIIIIIIVIIIIIIIIIVIICIAMSFSTIINVDSIMMISVPAIPRAIPWY